MWNHLKRQKWLVAFFLILIAIYMALFTDVFIETDFEQLKFSQNINTTEDFTASLDEHNTLTLTQDITKNMYGKSLSFYTSDSFVDVYINDNRIYHYGASSLFCKSPGSLWQFVELSPNDCSIGDTLKISIDPVYDDRYNGIPEIYLGSSGNMLMSLMSDGFFDLFLNLVIVFIGIVLIGLSLISFLQKNGFAKENLFLGLLSIFVVLWSSCELFVIQVLFPTGIGQYMIYYIFFQMIPLFLALYIGSLSTKPLKWTPLAYIVSCIVLGVLQILGIREYTETILFFLGSCVLLFVVMIWHFFKYKKKTLPNTVLAGLVILIAFTMLNILIYLFNPLGHARLILAKTGYIIYLLISLYVYTKQEIISIFHRHETEKMAKLALVDVLTGLQNRMAFVSDIQKLSLENIGIVSLDVNNLKYYNDTAGHLTGDFLLKRVSDLLVEIYGYSNVYRTGGDEFMCIYRNKYIANPSKDKESLTNLSIETENNSEDGIVIEIACGYSFYEYGDKTYEDIVKRSDRFMYKHKLELKKHSRLKKKTGFVDDRLGG